MEQELRNMVYKMMVEEGKGFSEVAQELQTEAAIVARAYVEEHKARHTIRRRIITPKYYLVGATWWPDTNRFGQGVLGEKTNKNDYDDKFPEFIKNGYWKMGGENNYVRKGSKPPLYLKERFNSIRKDDCIAIKRLLGREATEIKIKAIGRVTGKIDDIILVNWVLCPENRLVPIRGCIGTIYGPFHKNEKDKEWLEKVFSL